MKKKVERVNQDQRSSGRDCDLEDVTDTQEKGGDLKLLRQKKKRSNKKGNARLLGLKSRYERKSARNVFLGELQKEEGEQESALFRAIIFA